ncbi:ATP-grasp domain-containing protein, partial [Patescibacteria group bacterium]|nr:ATP-grasp domain-containing protein [Patescibacteria group bacterium]
MTAMKAIILDGHLKSALATTRSLGKKGVQVTTAAERGTAMSLRSRYSARRFVYPSPLTEPQAFVQAIISLAKKVGGMPVIYAFSDETFLLISKNRKEIQKYATLLLSSEESVDVAFDKKKTLALAKKLNIPQIESIQGLPLNSSVPIVQGLSLNNIFRAMSYPAVIKPQSSCVWKDGVGIKGTAEYVFTSDELYVRASALYKKTGKYPLAQTFIKGDEYGIEMLCQKGRIVAQVAHKRIRSLSPTGGAAVVKKTIYNNKSADEMESAARKIVEELNWDGVMMIEFKNDEQDNTLKLVEINGRFWGSLPLAIFAGVDFPYLFFKQCGGLVDTGDEDVNDMLNTQCQTNIISRHF